MKGGAEWNLFTPCEARFEHEHEEHGGDAGAVAADGDADGLADQHDAHADGHRHEELPPAHAVDHPPGEEGGEDIPQLDEAAEEQGRFLGHAEAGLEEGGGVVGHAGGKGSSQHFPTEMYFEEL